jgi:hypothetical protein
MRYLVPVVCIAAFIVLISLAMLTWPAHAQQATRPKPASAEPKIELPFDPLKLNKRGDGTTKCDFSLFAALQADSVVERIQQCVSDVANKFVPDVAAALASAQMYNGGTTDKPGDKPAVDCLMPALAIVQAAVGKPAVPEVPATATVPAVPAQPAQLPGPIVIFQKFREFQLSGGPAACKTWVNNTLTGAVAQ